MNCLLCPSRTLTKKEKKNRTTTPPSLPPAADLCNSVGVAGHSSGLHFTPLFKSIGCAAPLQQRATGLPPYPSHPQAPTPLGGSALPAPRLLPSLPATAPFSSVLDPTSGASVNALLHRRPSPARLPCLQRRLVGRLEVRLDSRSTSRY